MKDIQTFNDPAFKVRMTYFQSNTFKQRLACLSDRLCDGERPCDADFWKALGCSETEMAAWLTIVDAMEALAGREPRHGFPAIRDRGNATVDVKIAPNGDLIDYRFLEWAPGAAPANAKETMQ